jgi:hypothetical protein
MYAYGDMRRTRISICPQTSTLGFMDQALIRARLAQVEWHITVGEQTLARQRDIIAKLGRGGFATANADGTLRVLEQTQAARMADRDRILKGLRVGNPIASTLLGLSGP